MPHFKRAAVLDRISEQPELVIDFLVARGVGEPESAHEPAAIVVIILVIPRSRPNC